MSLVVPKRTEVPDTLEREVNRLGDRPRSTRRSGSPQPGQAEADEWDGGSSLVPVRMTQSQACPGASCSHLSRAPAANQDAGVRVDPGGSAGSSTHGVTRSGGLRGCASSGELWGKISLCNGENTVFAMGIAQPLQWHMIGACASHIPEGT